MTAPCAIAVDLGGTKLAVAVVDSGGAVIRREQCAVDRSDAVATANQIAGAAIRIAGDLQPAGAGCVVPGIARPEDDAVWAPNLWGMEFEPLGGLLRARLPWPLRIESDRIGHLAGEVWLGAARGARDAVFLAVGTGIGAGARGSRNGRQAAAVLLLGAGVAEIYPTVLGLAGSVFSQRSGTVFGILFTFGLTGGMTMPLGAGHTAAALSVGAALLIPGIAFAAIVLLISIAGRLTPGTR